MSEPLAYFITWTTYGSWLHGSTKWVNDEGYLRNAIRYTLAMQ
jgi:hypothetical protein